MDIQKKDSKLYWLILACFLFLFILSCGSKAKYVGIYQTKETKGEVRSELELNEEGEGYWRVGDNEESFSWYVKGKEIRLNTRKGGVIVATIQGETLEIILSGGKRIVFTKIK